MKTSEFDQRFDDGESVLEALDLSQARRQRLELKRVNVDFPLSMVEQLDREASRMGCDLSIDHQDVAGCAPRSPDPFHRQHTSAGRRAVKRHLSSPGTTHLWNNLRDDGVGTITTVLFSADD
jgi:hypothetical protein